MFKRLFLGLAATLLAASAWAAPITYKFWGQGSGALGQTGLQDATFLITAFADTDNISPWCCSERQNTSVSATIDIGGVGSFNFLAASHVWWADNCCMGFGANLGSNWLTLNASGFYGMDADYGPLFDASASTHGQFTNVSTSGGALSLRALTSGATFQADTANAVPEPGTALLAGLALLGIGAVRRRKLH